jgi:hypothetical protein
MIEADVDTMLQTTLVGRLGLCCGSQPYVIPINFAYHKGHIYFHCADVGMKIQYLRNNPIVCFEVDEHVGTVEAPVICNYETAYRSVVAFGRATILADHEKKTTALRLIVAKYAGNENAQKLETRTVEKYRSPKGSETVVVDIKIEKVTGKRYSTEQTS